MFLFDMNERMKIMIPYDGSINTEIALGALRRRADYSQVEHDALVVISDVWLADSAEEFTRAANSRMRKAALAGMLSHAPALRARDEERALSREALDRMTSMFPLWNVKVETLPGFSFVSSEILERADRSNSHVIVIGTRKPSAGGLNGVAAAALRVTEDTHCNVLLALENTPNGNAQSRQYLATRVALILNGDRGDEAIIRTAAHRKWPKNSQARVILRGADSSSLSTTQAEQTLNASGLGVSVLKPESNSLSAVTRDLIDWNPDGIFMCGERTGTNGNRSFQSEAIDILLKTKCPIELIRESHVRPKAMKAAA
jgi:nucleotide-binding universal stress UspA family protein